jgi:hypothetical protein
MLKKRKTALVFMVVGLLSGLMAACSEINNDITVKRLQLGRTSAIIVPVGDLFNGVSANFSAEARPLLAQIVRFIDQEHPSQVSIFVAYGAPSNAVSRALASSRAERMMAFLDNNKVDTRITYIKTNAPPASSAGLNYFYHQVQRDPQVILMYQTD